MIQLWFWRFRILVQLRPAHHRRRYSIKRGLP